MSETRNLTTPQDPTEVTAVATEATREPERAIAPAVDIIETKEGLVVIADLPGVAQDGIHIAVDNGLLTIKGTVDTSNGREYLYREFEPVAYFRQFTLGEKINQAAIKAEYKNGVLTLNLPFAEETKPRQITVNYN